MPELPEVQTIVSELKNEIVGKKIAEVNYNLPKMVVGDIKKIIGAKIASVSRRAKIIIVKLGGGLNLLFHLKMTGQLIYLPAGKDKTKVGERINKYTHVIFKLSDGSRLLFNDLRQFGWVKIFGTEDLKKAINKEKYGPEPLSKEFTLAKFQQMLAQKPNAKIKPLLMDQSFIAGIGNIYSDEILYFAKVHPLKKVKDLNQKDIEKIYEGILKILRAAILAKGTSIDTYRRTTGEKGTYALKRQVYQRKGLPCYHCQGKVQTVKIGGRTAHFCPGCQK
ncbi:MAG: formamidopyrimidine-DNA glycosylase [Candidatus Nealsonbacteria bacterium CG23_combo_of_CG06-09_8_20_14_all_40_13]|uniref:Formamidopyrimidine-DNA glycosylase n=1 Tax=Candidatus Nealsonbacteria bacterium CG23_combo_of_CG06-09_8_20_14_all_40_13 TaxID=1974724 RepID=A0A2G9YRK6_9BACT|nr:MAG: formamidopyrimidine-DNA glycosylase [Candidatus Nealsonbacteria bacterium CG23_combo_of_CG06-09_8_20_14_all_40_13]PIR71254.1 MAG: formamidopyrimidine-DNA glycosylase [Candidatus Nealsonbacteria bacterium CG10_big_fil_rev_8_21_14_0_10_40_24]PIU43273.1 MAG: formamidopyrimidine-DNA glycosylase [Candidatus Nealsonbacteria bacterium CG07_land_8_20_14_0_80_40_10]